MIYMTTFGGVCVHLIAEMSDTLTTTVTRLVAMYNYQFTITYVAPLMPHITDFDVSDCTLI